MQSIYKLVSALELHLFNLATILQSFDVPYNVQTLT